MNNWLDDVNENEMRERWQRNIANMRPIKRAILRCVLLPFAALYVVGMYADQLLFYGDATARSERRGK